MNGKAWEQFLLRSVGAGRGSVSRCHRFRLSVNGSGDDLEFGSNLAFQAPSRFLVDVVLEDGELLGVGSTTTSSSLVMDDASERKHVIDYLIGCGSGSNALPVTALPQGTVRKHYKGYEVAIIPPNSNSRNEARRETGMVLVCIATLACSVNLPAHTVVIKGTQIYDPKAGGWKDLGMFDVMQFVSSLKDNLNAEVALGTMTDVKEACAWLGYTYIFIRMRQKLSFTVPIFEPQQTPPPPPPKQYYIRAVSVFWLHSEAFCTITFHNLALSQAHTSHTELLELKPLPTTLLGNSTYEALYNFSHFNPIQTQIFHVLYHTDDNVLLGAPRGSGKTISAELAMLSLFNTQRDMKPMLQYASMPTKPVLIFVRWTRLTALDLIQLLLQMNTRNHFLAFRKKHYRWFFAKFQIRT
ncbi:hypothetical protein Tsubulata_037475 [Turnera subulata]|uniref:DEAD/DEAH box helicase domain-containing protein n=1 Tax=Turnera subulata TaxID=218843 RepID=A0A9Q0FH92_9ROSI|nr:hypothetical protein Tsubulata_037475 [Turnera subulata]